MKFLRKLILWLLIALLVVIIAAYFLLQTQWGGRQASAWLSDGTGHPRPRRQTRHAGGANGGYWF